MSLPRLVFIVGPPRSGTTLLLDILSGHDDVLALGPEVHPFHHDLSRFPWHVGEHYHFTTAHASESIRSEYISFLDEKFDSKKQRLCVIKVSTFSQQIDYLATLFPDARFIQLVRDARDSICSYEDLRQTLSKEDGETRYLGPAIDPLSYECEREFHNPLLNAACSWFFHVTRSYLDLQFFNKENVLRLRYEDLVDAPLRTLQLVLRFLDLTATKKKFEFWCKQVTDKPLPDALGFSHSSAKTARVKRFESDLHESIRALVASLIRMPMLLLGYPADILTTETDLSDAASRHSIDLVKWRTFVAQHVGVFEQAHTAFMQVEQPMTPKSRPLLIPSAVVETQCVPDGAYSLCRVRKQDRVFEMADPNQDIQGLCLQMNGELSVQQLTGESPELLRVLGELHGRGFIGLL